MIDIIKTIGDFREVTKNLSDDFNIDVRIMQPVPEEILKNSRYPYPWNHIPGEIEFQDIGYSDKDFCIGIYEKEAEPMRGKKEPVYGDWISYKDTNNRPKENEEVLVQVTYGTDKDTMHKSGYANGVFEWETLGQGRIVAWTSLPPQYKGD